jgi:hypothetical protein
VVCRECGKAFPVKPRDVRTAKGDLEELTPERLAQRLVMNRKRQEQGRAGTYEALVNLGRMRGMKHPDKWATHVMAARAAKRRIG